MARHYLTAAGHPKAARVIRLTGTFASVLLLGAFLANRSLARSPQKSSAAATPAPVAGPTDSQRCRSCHAEEVDGFSRSRMAHSMHVDAKEPAGVVQVPGTRITMFSDSRGSWQRLESHGATSTFHVDYVIGSGAHAAGYITDIAGHLFQSPVAFYSSRSAYDLAPGYEGKADPDFTRPVAEGCVFCHAGSFNAIAGTGNRYGTVPFPHLAIGCDRCHGSAAAHLAKPEAGNIVNPPHLAQAARDSVCEQCHLFGAARILNPGKRVTDFVAGQPLEDTLTIYHNVLPQGSEANFKVISHSEQLALSKCQRSSGGRLWCGTCHDPHNEPSEPVAFYRERCLLCHAKTPLAAAHPPKTSNCIGCHMPTRNAQDGGHTAFTDHRIQRRPDSSTASTEQAVLAPWRQPPIDLANRNLGIASVGAGAERRDWKEVVAGYRLLTGVQEQFPQDSELFNTIGTALFVGKQYGEAAEAFELAIRFDPDSAPKQTSLGQTYLLLGKEGLAEQHLQKALQVDPLDLGAATLLIELYQRTGNSAKAAELQQQLGALINPR